MSSSEARGRVWRTLLYALSAVSVGVLVILLDLLRGDMWTNCIALSFEQGQPLDPCVGSEGMNTPEIGRRLGVTQVEAWYPLSRQ
jgi:hypothetical protein